MKNWIDLHYTKPGIERYAKHVFNIMLGLLSIAVLVAMTSTAQARVIKLEILDEQNPAFDSRVFGDAGTFRRISARVHCAVDPGDVHNSGIIDLDKAPRNADGEVEFSSEVVIVQPSDPERGNHRLFVCSN